MMDIEISKAGYLFLDVPQQHWHGDDDQIMQVSRFAGQEMMSIQKSDDEPDIYELHYLGLMTSGFESMDDAKTHAPAFAKAVLKIMSGLIKEIGN